MMDRREFLRHLTTAAVGTRRRPLRQSVRPRLRFAQTGNRQVGRRHLPAGRLRRAQYRRALRRRRVLHVAQPTSRSRRRTPANATAAIDLDAVLRPAPRPGAAGAALDRAGRLAVLPPSSTRTPRSPTSTASSTSRRPHPTADLDGWLNRHIITLPQAAALRAVRFGNELPDSLRGQAIVSTFNDIASFTPGAARGGRASPAHRPGRVYSQSPDNTKAYRTLVQEHGRVMVNDLAVLSGIDPTPTCRRTAPCIRTPGTAAN